MFNCEFDRLFKKSVPHILEKIFFSLDYNSFKSKEWNDLLSSHIYQRQAERLLAEKEENEQKLLQYSMYGDVAAVRHLLTIGTNPNQIIKWESDSYWAATPLRTAAMKDHTDVMNLLLEAGADPNYTNRKGKGALLSAVQCAKKNATQLLIRAGAEIDKEDINGRSPLFHAVTPETQ